jgi:hypothetical protein
MTDRTATPEGRRQMRAEYAANGIDLSELHRAMFGDNDDEPFVAPWRRRSIEQAGGRFLAVADTTDR